MSGWDESWQVARVNPGVQLLVRLRRTGGLADSPQEEQVRQRLGKSPKVAASIGDCQSLLDDPTNVVCSEYHARVTIVSGTPVVLGNVLPPTINVRSGGVLGVDVFNQQQTWELTGVKRLGRVSQPERQRRQDRQEQPPAEPEGPLSSLGTPMLALIAMLALAFLFTGAGQRLVDAGVESSNGGEE